jgi:RimJ/RimL family protein N-acetyltransferase
MTRTFPDGVILKSDRLVLRPFEAADIADAAEACADELTQRWLPLPNPYTLDHATAWCTRTAHELRASGDGIQFAVTDAHSGRLLGAIGLNRTSWPSLVTEIGYWTAPWARGQGIAADATRLLAAWALTDQGFARIEVRAATANAASQRVALKAGLHQEGILRNAGFVHAGRVDLVLFSLVPSDLR